MSESPEVSVIIPCYNVGEYVEEAIRSVAQACSAPFEIIAVDNGSTDETLPLLQRLQGEIKALSVLQEPTPGASHARNKGLAAAKGTFIQFLDADDFLLANKLDHQLALIKTHEAALVCAHYLKRDVKGNETEVRTAATPFFGLFTTRLGITSSCLFRADAVRSVNGWNASLRSSQEYDLMFRILQTGATAVLDAQPLTVVRERPHGQISTSDPVPRWKQYLALRCQILDYLQTHAVGEYVAQKAQFHQAFYDTLHIVWPHQPIAAEEAYDHYLGKKFLPQPSAAVTPFFVKLHRLLGFRRAERFKALLRK